MFVYLVINNANGKQYVGQHSGDDLQAYWYKSLFFASKKYPCGRPLIKAIRKYGLGAFSIKPLVVVGTKWELDLYEIGMIKALNTKAPNGYNCTDGGEGMLNPSDETRMKMSKAQMGNKYCLGRFESEETRHKKSIAHIGNQYAVGAVRTPEYCQQISERQKGRKFSDETKKKMSEAAKGKIVSKETRKKMADHRRGNPTFVNNLKKYHAEAVKKAVHVRHHVNRNVVKIGCTYCNEANQCPNGNNVPQITLGVPAITPPQHASL